MRNSFPLFYHLSENEKKSLFSSPHCYFVFDTNALLDIYRLGRETAEKVLQVLDKFKDRIVIPKHVAKEYHENMLDIITEVYSKYDDFLRRNKTDDVLNMVITTLKIDNSPSIRRKTTKFLKPAIEDLFNDVGSERGYTMAQFQTWDLQNKLSDALGTLVLDGFSGDRLKEIEKEGEDRYSRGIPPGYMDLKTKDENVYGDFIIWKEILEFAKSKQCSIIFISRDMKEDWLQILHGMTCGPRQELLDEFNTYSPKGRFYIYTLDQFLLFANELNKVLDDSELIEVQDLALVSPIEKNDETKNKLTIPQRMSSPEDDKSEALSVEKESVMCPVGPKCSQ